MAEIINLNHFRKARLKDDKDAQAAQNRVRHGRRKDDRKRQRLEDERRRQKLDEHRLRDDDMGEDEPA